MTHLKGIHHVGIVVQNIESSAAWYVDKLGFERLYAFELPGVRAAFIGRGDVLLELFEDPDAAPMAKERQGLDSNLKIGGINHFAIAVDDLDATLTDLRARGIDIVSPAREVPNSGGSRFAFIHDNERMLVELFEAGEG